MVKPVAETLDKVDKIPINTGVTGNKTAPLNISIASVPAPIPERAPIPKGKYPVSVRI